MADKKLKLEVIMGFVDQITGSLKTVNSGSQRMVAGMKAARQAVKELEEQQSKLDKFNRAKASAQKAQTEYAERKEALDQLNKKLAESRTAQEGMAGAVMQARAGHKELMAAFARNDAIPGLSNKLYQAKQNLEKLEAQYSKAKSTTGHFKTEVAGITTALEHASKSKENWREALSRTKGALVESGVDIRKLSEHQEDLKKKTAAATEAVEKQGKAMERMHAAQAQAAKTRALAGRLGSAGTTMAVAGAAVTAPVAKAVMDYSKFEDAMLGVARQVEGARDANGQLTRTYHDMASEIKRLSTTIPMATVEIAKIVEAGARMGIQGKENLIEFAKTTAMTATAFDLPVDQVGEQMGKLAQLYKIPIPSISTLGDVINHLDDNALAKGGDIIDVMQRIAGTAAGVNMTAKEAAALGSSFLSLGAGAEVAATASNAMIRELSIATMQPKRFQEGLRALGLEAKQLQTSMPKDATGTILMVLDKLKSVSGDQRTELATRLFGKEYGDDAAKLAENLDEYRRQLKLVNDEKAKGSMQREGDARGATLSASGQILSNKFFNLTSALGETQRGTVDSITNAIGGLMDRITAFVQANPGLASAIVTTVSALGIMLVVFGGLAVAVAGVLGPFAMARLAFTSLGIQGFGISNLFAKTASAAKAVGGAMQWAGRIGAQGLAFMFSKVVGALKSAGTAVMWLGRIFLANPILLAAALIAAAAYYVWSNWETIGPRFLATWANIKQGTQDVWDATVAYVAGACARVFAYFAPLVLFFKTQWENIKGAFTAAWDFCVAYLAGLPGKFTTIGGQVIDGLMAGLKQRWEATKAWFADLGNKIAQTTRDALGVKSPSRVFAVIGQHVMEGLGVGLNAGEGGPLDQVRRTAGKLAGIGAAMGIGLGAAGGAGASTAPFAIDTRPPLSPSGASTPRGSQAAPIINITINAAPGMDERALARLVATEIERHQRQAQSAQRSRLTDAD